MKEEVKKKTSMNVETISQFDTRWLEPWRTTADCTSGGLGLFCAMENFFVYPYGVRKDSCARERGKQTTEAGGQLDGFGLSSGSSAAAAFSSASRRTSPSGKLRDADVSGMSALQANESSAVAGSSCSPHDDSGVVGSATAAAATVPPISGFRTAVCRWETQAAIVAAMDRLDRNRRRRIESDNDDDDDENNTALPNVVETARPAQLRTRFCSSNDSWECFDDDGEKLLAKRGEEEDVMAAEVDDSSVDDLGAERHLSCLPGDVLNNRYFLIRQLGCGESNRVWLAVDLDQRTAACRKLLRELDENQLQVYFSFMNRPLFVAIKVFHCGSEFDNRAEMETLMLSYMKECRNVEKLQSLMSNKHPSTQSHVESASFQPQELSECSKPAVFSPRSGRCIDAGTFNSGDDDMIWVPPAWRIPFVRERFRHRGSFGFHECIVVDVMGDPVSTITEAAGFHGLPVDHARGVVRSALEGLTLLGIMHVVHSDISPQTLLLAELGKTVSEGMMDFLAHSSKKLLSMEEEFLAALGQLPDKRLSGGSHHTEREGLDEDDEDDDHQQRLLRWRRWGSGVESPFMVQLCGLGSSLIVPHDLRRSDSNARGNSEGVVCGGDKDEAAANDVTYSPSSRMTGRSFSSPSVADELASHKASTVSSVEVLGQLADLSKLVVSLTSPTGVIGELERELISRQSYRRGMKLQSRKYRSPEIILGKDFGTAIDVWSMGCVAFELIIGRSLFDPVSEYMDAMAQDKTAKGTGGKCKLNSEGNNSGDFQESAGLGNSLMASSSTDCDNVDVFLNFACFGDFEKNVDVYHLRGMIFLLGVPDPHYILSSPFGEYAKDFFDSNGKFFFLRSFESAQLYGNNDVNDVDIGGGGSLPCSSTPCAASHHDTSMVNGSGLSAGNSFAPSRGCRGCTPAWLKIRDEIFSALGEADGAVFESFLRKCLQWDPAQRQSARGLLMDRWVLTGKANASV